MSVLVKIRSLGRLGIGMVRNGLVCSRKSYSVKQGLVERLKNGGNIVIAEGYMWELERRGYVSFGTYTPEILLDKPEVVKNLSQDFEHAGSDVIEAFTYFGYREKLKHADQESETEKLNRVALRIAREVADTSGKLMAGNISNTPLYQPGNQEICDKITQMFKEQIVWAVEEGADYIIGETFSEYGEAVLALEAIQRYGKGVPAVITLAAYIPDETTDDIPIPEACRKLEEAGAAVVGLNCGRGPETMLPLLQQVREACKGPIAALPVAFRTSQACPSLQSLKDPLTGQPGYPDNIDCVRCTKSDVRSFAEEAKSLGVQYVGLCCGNGPNLIREVADVYGRKPGAMKYASDMKKSFVFGDKAESYSTKKLRKHMIGK